MAKPSETLKALRQRLQRRQIKTAKKKQQRRKKVRKATEPIRTEVKDVKKEVSRLRSQTKRGGQQGPARPSDDDDGGDGPSVAERLKNALDVDYDGDGESLGMEIGASADGEKAQVGAIEELDDRVDHLSDDVDELDRRFRSAHRGASADPSDEMPGAVDDDTFLESMGIDVDDEFGGFGGGER